MPEARDLSTITHGRLLRFAIHQRRSLTAGSRWINHARTMASGRLWNSAWQAFRRRRVSLLPHTLATPAKLQVDKTFTANTTADRLSQAFYHRFWRARHDAPQRSSVFTIHGSLIILNYSRAGDVHRRCETLLGGLPFPRYAGYGCVYRSSSLRTYITLTFAAFVFNSVVHAFLHQRCAKREKITDIASRLCMISFKSFATINAH